MAVGAYSTYKLATAFPDLNIIVVFLLAGVITAGVGLIFGTPSLRIKGFYLAVATLAAQFFLSWMFNKVPWFYNYNPSGTITMPPRTVFGVMVTGPAATAEARVHHRPPPGDAAGAGGEEHRPQPYRAILDGDPGHGHRRGAHRLPAVADQADWRSRCRSFYCRRGGRDDTSPCGSAASRPPRPSTSTSPSRCCSWSSSADWEAC